MTNLINHPAINIVGEEWNAIMKNVSIAQYKVANRQWQWRRVSGGEWRGAAEHLDLNLFKKFKIRNFYKKLLFPNGRDVPKVSNGKEGLY